MGTAPRRYFLTRKGEPEIEVTEAEFVVAERANGFYPEDGGDENKPATGGFGNSRIRGRIDFDNGKETTTP